MRKVKVIYIVGAGYSGSTVLGAILGMHPNFVDAGELHLRRFSPPDANRVPCSCGEPTPECPFWRAVYTEFTKSVSPTEIEDYQARMVRYQRFRSFPRLVLGSMSSANDFTRFQREALAMIQSLASASCKPAVVDVSKAPMRAIALASIPEIDLRLIHLVRNGLAQLTSTYKHHGKKWSRQGMSSREISTRAAQDWLVANLGAEFAIRMSRRAAIRVRYEDLLVAPEQFIVSLSGVVGEDMTHVAQRVAAGDAIDFGHAGGNIAGRGGPKPLNVSDDWQERLAPDSRQVFRLRAGWLNRHYGYQEP